MKTNRKSNQKKELQSRPEQSFSEVKPVVDLAKRQVNRIMETDVLLGKLREEFPRFYELAEVIGKWVWVTFPEKQPVEVTSALSQLGFHWNNLRQAWQHPCGTTPTVELRQYDPRKRYGAHFAADQKAA